MKSKVIQYSILFSFLLGFTLSGFSFDEDSEVSIGVKRGMKVRKTKDKQIKKLRTKKKSKKKFFFKLNTKKTFEHVKPQNAFVFMVGNDDYDESTGFSKLGQCFNDVRLLRQIFINCVKIDKKNIYTNKDLTLDEFHKRFREFLKKLDEESMVIITYSGHGNDDGSLVMVDGTMLIPDELKRLVNSFKNDTVLLLDACYSGGNEGPKEMYKQGKKLGFKSNSFRIYASLAHLTAKEIQYNNVFFNHLMPFYRDVLELEDITGNGYFTAMIGLFFSEYKFKPNENISFKDLVSYVTNKGKQYVEYLAVRGKESRSERKEAVIRLNQQPKILPISEKVDFFNVNHQFILVQKPIEPAGLEPSISAGLFFPMGNTGRFYESPGLMVTASLNYELDFVAKDLFTNFNLSFASLTPKDISTRRGVSLNILIPTLGVKYYLFKVSIISMSLGVEGGLAVTFANVESFGTVKEESRTYTNLYAAGTGGLYFEVFKDFNIFALSRFAYIKYSDPLYGVSSELGVNYYF